MAPLGGVPFQRTSASRVGARAPRGTRPRAGCPVSAVLMLGLALAQLVLYVDSGSGEPWGAVLVAAVCVLVLPISVALWTGRMCECRFFAVAVALAVGVGQVVAATVGAPGGAPLGWSAGRVVVVVLAGAAVAMVLRHVRFQARAARSVTTRTPYASADGTPAAGRGGRRRDRRAAATDVGA
jgi:hypothetical protein